MKSYQKIKILLAAQFYTFVNHRKITKFDFIQNYNMFETNVFAREVSQKSILALPCCMGVVMFLIRTQRGNAKNIFCGTSSARMRFFIFRHLPNGKLKNHEHALREPPRRRHVAKDAIRKSLQKSQIPPATCFFCRFLKFIKILLLRSKSIEISNGFKQLAKVTLCRNTSGIINITHFA